MTTETYDLPPVPINIDLTDPLVLHQWLFEVFKKLETALDAITGVSSFNSRVGIVLPLQADYDAFFLTTAEGNALYSLLAHVHPGDPLVDADGDTQIQVEETADEDIIRFDLGDSLAGFPALANALIFSGGEFTVTLPAADVSGTTGGAISWTAGNGLGTGNGGGFTLDGGDGGVTDGDGGRLTFRPGAAGGGDGRGGDFHLLGQPGAGTGDGSDFLIQGGNGGSSGGDGGNFFMQGGSGGGTTGPGGTLTISSGGAASDGAGGVAILRGGPAGLGTSTAGTMLLHGGDAPTGAGSTADGAICSVRGGNAGITSGATGDGADLNLDGGDGGATSGDGGDVVISGGAGDTEGDVLVNSDVIHDGAHINVIATLADSATPSVAGGKAWLTGGTTTITDLTGGAAGQEVIILSEHAITITDNGNFFLAGGDGAGLADFVMASSDSLYLIQKADGNWYEISRSVN